MAMIETVARGNKTEGEQERIEGRTATPPQLDEQKSGQPASALPKILHQEKKAIEALLADCPFAKDHAEKLRKLNARAIEAYQKSKRQQDVDDKRMWSVLDSPDFFRGRVAANLRKFPESEQKAFLRKKGARI